MKPETEWRSSRRFRSIRAWQLADDLAASVYQATKEFPRDELYGLTSQMRKAAVSVAANIVEGSSRRSRQEYLQILSVAKASLSEVSYYIHLSKRLTYLSESRASQLDSLCEETARTLYGLIQAVSKDRALVSSLMSHV
jgi:four helix bundle protein